MPVRIRLRRVGRKKQPSYRIVVSEGQSPRSGTYIDNVGFYNPRQDPVELKIDLEKVDHWIARGAEVTPTVKSLIRKARQGSAGVEAPKAQAAAAPAAAKAESSQRRWRWPSRPPQRRKSRRSRRRGRAWFGSGPRRGAALLR